MKSIFTLLLISIIATWASAFNVGHISATYTDAARAGRSVPCEIYYPATTSGEATPWASGVFPYVIIGHGFVMSPSNYLYLADSLATHGFIAVLPSTEISISPSHAAFAADLLFLRTQILQEGATSSSAFYNKVASQSAVMGHSMGGGASFLAAQSGSGFTTLVNFAAAETTPSATAAAALVDIPALIFVGDNDCVVAPTTTQAMYDALPTGCKYFLSIDGGTHCNFADDTAPCSLGELTCTPAASLSTQHTVLCMYLLPYLKYYLYNSTADYYLFQERITAHTGIAATLDATNCTMPVGIAENHSSPLFIQSLSHDQLYLNQSIAHALIEIYSIDGSMLRSTVHEGSSISVQDLATGTYILRLRTSDQTTSLKFVKNE